MRASKRFLFKIICTCLGVSGVFASFNYATNTASPQESIVELSVFEWVGVDVLPDAMGTDHKVLIENLIGDSVGLNNADSYLNQQITARKENFFGSKDTFGSSDFWQNSNVSEEFNADTYNLSFLVYFPNPFTDSDNDGQDDVDESETTQYIFTTSVNLGTSSSWGVSAKPNVPIGEYVYPVYKTTVVKRYGEWVATATELGAAKSAYYDHSLAGAGWLQTPSFDPETWRSVADIQPRIGTKENAIYTYLHILMEDSAATAGVPSIDGYETSTHLANSAMQEVYYQYPCTTAGEYAFAFTDTCAELTVYNENWETVETTLTTDGTKRYVWQAATGRYYFQVNGVAVAYFTLYAN